MPKKQYFEKIIDIPIFNGKLGIILSNDLKKVSKKLSELEWGHLYADTCRMTNNDIYIVLNPYDHDINCGTIAHESLHAVDFRFETIREDGKPMECTHYFLDWVVNQVIAFMIEKKAKISL